MISSLFAFLGGSVFRMIWGELSAWLTKAQDHTQEVERMKLSAQYEAERHARQLESIAQQASLGIQVIRAQSEAHIAELDAASFSTAVTGTTLITGMVWLDAWNQGIRPFLATWSIFMITADHYRWIVLSDNGWMLASAALGIYVADRSLFKRGK